MIKAYTSDSPDSFFNFSIFSLTESMLLYSKDSVFEICGYLKYTSFEALMVPEPSNLP